MKGFTPTAESRGFSPDLLWSGLRSGCRATKSRRSRSESAKLSATRACPWGSTGVTDKEWFACVTLLKQDWPKAQGLSLKAITSNWARLNRKFSLPCSLSTSLALDYRDYESENVHL